MFNNTTNELDLNNKIDQDMIYINTKIVNTLPAAVAKGAYIDLPVNLLEVSDPAKIFTNTQVSITSYAMRYEINGIGKFFGVNKYLTALATCPAGYYKYDQTGQNPYVGCVNIALYELCNQIDLCANNKYVNTAFTVTVEALDAGVQTAMKVSEGNIFGAVISALRGGVKIGASLNLNQIVNNAKSGAKIGFLIEGAVYLLYVPSLDLMGKEEKLVSNSYAERLLEYIYKSDFIKELDMYTDEF